MTTTRTRSPVWYAATHGPTKETDMTDTTNTLCRVWHDGFNARYHSEWCDVPTPIVRKAASLRKLTMADNAPLALTWIEQTDFNHNGENMPWHTIHIMVGQVKIGFANYPNNDVVSDAPSFYLVNNSFGFREVSESHWTKTIRNQLRSN